MNNYLKIQSVFKRDADNNFKTFTKEYSIPEIEYLKDNVWVWTEKVDGTNMRVCFEDGRIKIGGRTDNAQIYTPLLERMNELFTKEKLEKYEGLTFFGEGYGRKIQKVGSAYKPDGVDFILFDIQAKEGIWLKSETVDEIAKELGINRVETVGRGTLAEAIEFTKEGYVSCVSSNLSAEGIVLRPTIELKDRMNKRIITKLKYKDFNKKK